MQAPVPAGVQPDDMMAGYGQQPDPFGGQPGGAGYGQPDDQFGAQAGGADFSAQDGQFGQPGDAYADPGYGQQYGQQDPQGAYGDPAAQPYQDQNQAQPDYAEFQQQAIDYQSDAMNQPAQPGQAPGYDDQYPSAQYGQDAPQQAPAYDDPSQPRMRPVHQRGAAPQPEPEDGGNVNVFNSAAAPSGADYGDPTLTEPVQATPQTSDPSGYPEFDGTAAPAPQDDDDQGGRGKGRHIKTTKERPQKGAAKNAKPGRPANRQEAKAKQRPQRRPAPAATGAGGIDPMAIVALWASGTGPLGLILSIVAMTRRKLYPVGRYLSTIALVVSILASISWIGLGAMVSVAMNQANTMMSTMKTLNGGSVSGADQQDATITNGESIAYVEYDWNDGTQANA